MMNLDIGFYFSLFRRRLPIFLTAVILTAIVGVVVISILPAVYRATAEILVESPQIPVDMARSTVPTGATEQFQIIQEDVLSRENLLALAERFKIYSGLPQFTKLDIVDDMKARIGIQPVQLAGGAAGAATVFQISFDAAQPQLAADVANELVAMILREDVELRTNRANGTVQFFTQEVTRLDSEIKALDANILEFKNAHINALPDSLNFRREQQSALQQRLLLLTQEEATLRRRQAELQAHPLAGDAVAATPEAKNLMDLQQALATQLGVFSEDSPTIKSLRARITALAQQIGSEKSATPDDAAGQTLLAVTNPELASIGDRLAAIAKEKSDIAKASDALNTSIDATPANETVLNSMERNHQNLQAQYNASVARLADASTGQQIELRLKGERLSLIESAVPPQSPASPKRKLLLVGLLVAALALGLATVIVPEFLNKSIRRPVELVTKMDIRPMITVPYIAGRGDRSRRRVTSIAAALLALAAVPLLAMAMHSYISPAEQAGSGGQAGLSDDPHNG